MIRPAPGRRLIRAYCNRIAPTSRDAKDDWTTIGLQSSDRPITIDRITGAMTAMQDTYGKQVRTTGRPYPLMVTPGPACIRPLARKL